MTLSEFVSALTNTSALITVTDSDDTQLIKFVASGSDYVLETTLASTVESVTIVNATSITVKLSE